MKFNTKTTVGNIRSKHRGCNAIYIKQLLMHKQAWTSYGDYEYSELQTLEQL
jgi:hypothetical protein